MYFYIMYIKSGLKVMLTNCFFFSWNLCITLCFDLFGSGLCLVQLYVMKCYERTADQTSIILSHVMLLHVSCW